MSKPNEVTTLPPEQILQELAQKIRQHYVAWERNQSIDGQASENRLLNKYEQQLNQYYLNLFTECLSDKRIVKYSFSNHPYEDFIIPEDAINNLKNKLGVDKD